MRKLAALFFLASFSAYAEPELKILSWRENSEITANGKNSEILINGKTIGLGQNQFLTAFGIGFGSNEDLIKITNVICDGKPAKYSFAGNVLKIEFPKPKANNQLVSMSFAYEMQYAKVSRFLRQEIIDIPKSAAGADARVTLTFPREFESATFNPNITKSGNNFTYSNISVPAGGVAEIVKLTESSGVFDVAVKVKIASEKPLKNLTITVPTYFQNPRQEVQNYTIFTNVKPLEQKTRGNDKIFIFNSNSREINVASKARITTGNKVRRMETALNPLDYMKVNEEETNLLLPILRKIKQDQNNRNWPLHIRIGKFVNEFIKYDKNYVGRLPSLKEILQNPIGVCTEYARLYDALLRVAGIPSFTIHGGACGEYDTCQGHSWNMLFHNNRWIEVDPTWNLMSGLVSSSHIYFKDSNRQDVIMQYFENQGGINSEIELEMKEVNN